MTCCSSDFSSAIFVCCLQFAQLCTQNLNNALRKTAFQELTLEAKQNADVCDGRDAPATVSCIPDAPFALLCVGRTVRASVLCTRCSRARSGTGSGT